MLLYLYPFNLMVLVQLIVTLVLKCRPSRFWKVRSIFSHFVRRDILHLSETVSPSSDSTTTRQKFSSLSILSNEISSREREEAMYLPRSSSKHTSSDHGALPPCPKSCQNMTRTWDTSATKNRRTAGVNTR